MVTSKPSSTNYPKLSEIVCFCDFFLFSRQYVMILMSLVTSPNLGGYSAGVPPLPIPNREVKPASADDTAFGGKVGRCRIF